MNPIEALVKIQMIKAQAVKKITSIPYMLPEDYEDITSWPTELAEKVLAEMRYRCKMPLIKDGKVCPWCLETYFSDTDCVRCKYAKRHGNCDKGSSDYSCITGLAYSSIIKLPRVNLKIQKILKEHNNG